MSVNKIYPSQEGSIPSPESDRKMTVQSASQISRDSLASLAEHKPDLQDPELNLIHKTMSALLEKAFVAQASEQGPTSRLLTNRVSSPDSPEIRQLREGAKALALWAAQIVKVLDPKSSHKETLLPVSTQPETPKNLWQRFYKFMQNFLRKNN